MSTILRLLLFVFVVALVAGCRNHDDDKTCRLTRLTYLNDDGSVQYWYDYRYTGDRLTEVVGGDTSYLAQYDYDELGRVSEWRILKSDFSELGDSSRYICTYQQNLMRISLVKPDGQESFANKYGLLDGRISYIIQEARPQDTIRVQYADNDLKLLHYQDSGSTVIKVAYTYDRHKAFPMPMTPLFNIPIILRTVDAYNPMNAWLFAPRLSPHNVLSDEHQAFSAIAGWSPNGPLDVKSAQYSYTYNAYGYPKTATVINKYGYVFEGGEPQYYQEDSRGSLRYDCDCR